MEKMKNYILCFLIAVCFQSSSTVELVIYAPSSFATGVGHWAKKEFEEKHKCKITYKPFSGLVHLLSSKSFRAGGDGVVCVSHEMLMKKEIEDLFTPLSVQTFGKFPSWKSHKFIPLSYSVLGFVYDTKKLKKPIHNFEDLVKSKEKIILMDPRTSNPGLGLLLWIKRIYGPQSSTYWRRLSPQILTMPKSWSEAYALFMQGEAPIVLGYITSPAYHRLMEKKTNVKSISFTEGNYIQVNVAGIFKSCRHKPLLESFIHFLLSKKNQKRFVFQDWSYPAIVLDKPLPEEFRNLEPKDQPLASADILKYKSQWLREWKEALS